MIIIITSVVIYAVALFFYRVAFLMNSIPASLLITLVAYVAAFLMLGPIGVLSYFAVSFVGDLLIRNLQNA